MHYNQHIFQICYLSADTFGRRFILIFLFCFLVFHKNSQGQVSLQNIGFETGTFTGWNGFTGHCCPVYTPFSGLTSGQHSITSGLGTDLWSNGLIPVTAPGSQYSVKLGNDSISAESEMLSTTFIVPADSLILLVKYATVIENGLHPDYKQSRFSYNITSSGNFPEGCTSIEILAGDTSASVVTIGDIEILPWQTKAISLFGLTGDTIYIQFITADCAPGGHFGYAYVDCEVIPANLITNGCDSSGSILATINPALDIQWHDGTSNNHIAIDQPVINGNYFVEFNYNFDCSFRIPILVDNILSLPSFHYTELCNNEIAFSNNSNTPSGTTFLWDFGDGNFSNQNNPVHQFTSENQFEVVLIAHLPNNCFSSTFTNITIGPPTIQNVMYNDSCINSNITFNSLPFTTAIPILSYKWFIDNVYVAYGPEFNYEFREPGIYDISLIIEDSNGCTDTLSKLLSISEYTDCSSSEYTLFIPNAFTPNNDGINDTFKPFYASGTQDHSLQIFNRYGELIYEGTEWNGKFNDKNCMSGVYLFKIIKNTNNRYILNTGTLNLIR